MADQDLSRLHIEKTKSPQHRKRRGGYVLTGLFLLLIGSGFFLYRAGYLTPAIPVQVAAVQNFHPAQSFTLLNASGYVVAQRKAAVATKITGRLVYLGVEEGNRVKEGQLIARLENEDLLAARERAEANLEVARHNLVQSRAELANALAAYKRDRVLFEKKYLPRSDYDTAEARYKMALAAVASREAGVRAATAVLAEAEIQLEYANIRAPFDAVVVIKNADVGDIVTPLGAAANAKAAVVEIADMDSLQVEVDVSESNIARVRRGQPSEIQLDAVPDARFPGEVHMIVPTADRTKASVLVKISFREKDPRILPEMSAKVAFLSREISPGEEKPILALPRGAVFSDDGRGWVFAVREGRAEKTAVETGRVYGDRIEIVKGVSSGDKVAVSPLDKITGGARVKTPVEER